VSEANQPVGGLPFSFNLKMMGFARKMSLLCGDRHFDLFIPKKPEKSVFDIVGNHCL
jgi:hypothetical protein